MIALVLPFIRSNWRIFAAIVALLAILGAVAGFALHERHLGRLAAEQAQEEAREKAAAVNAAALAQADKQRAEDAVATINLQKDLNRAYANTPDSRPSAARLALACERLRREGRTGAKLPAVCGPASAR